MIKINFIKFFSLLFTCKSATDIIHNKRKYVETNSESEENEIKQIKKPCTPLFNDIFIGVKDQLNLSFYDRNCFLYETDTTNMAFSLEEDYTQSAEYERGTSFAIFNEFEQLEPVDIENDKSLNTISIEKFLANSSSEEDECGGILISQFIAQNEDLNKPISHNGALKRLNILYSNFIEKMCNINIRDTLNRCFALFPETLTLLYIKVKNNENDRYINNILKIIYNLYQKNVVYVYFSASDIYLKRISFRKQMLNILRDELPSLSSHVLLYEKLVYMEEKIYNQQLIQKCANFMYTKRITNMFNIVFLIEREIAYLFLEIIEDKLKNIDNIKNVYALTGLDFDEFGKESFIDKTVIMKEIYDGVLSFLPSYNEKRQILNDYFKTESDKIQNKKNNYLGPIDIFKMLDGLERYKETFKNCVPRNSASSFKSFLPKPIYDSIAMRQDIQ